MKGREGSPKLTWNGCELVFVEVQLGHCFHQCNFGGNGVAQFVVREHQGLKAGHRANVGRKAAGELVVLEIQLFECRAHDLGWNRAIEGVAAEITVGQHSNGTKLGGNSSTQQVSGDISGVRRKKRKQSMLLL